MIPVMGLSVVALENERGIGAAEAEGVRQDGIDLGIVDALAATIGTPSNSGSSSVIWALSPMKPACIINRP